MVAVSDVYACDIGDMTLWARGHLNKHKFKGACLSAAGRFDGSGTEDEDKEAILKAKVHHGWVLTCAGDPSGCGGDYSIYFVDEPPKIVDGRWDGGKYYSVLNYGPDGEEYDDAEVADGPHEATWLVIDGT